MGTRHRDPGIILVRIRSNAICGPGCSRVHLDSSTRPQVPFRSGSDKILGKDFASLLKHLKEFLTEFLREFHKEFPGFPHGVPREVPPEFFEKFLMEFFEEFLKEFRMELCRVPRSSSGNPSWSSSGILREFLEEFPKELVMEFLREFRTAPLELSEFLCAFPGVPPGIP